jgi:hypothetical protein
MYMHLADMAQGAVNEIFQRNFQMVIENISNKPGVMTVPKLMNGTEIGVYLPNLGEMRLVTVRHGARIKNKTLMFMKDIETGYNACGFTFKECRRCLEELLTPKAHEG